MAKILKPARDAWPWSAMPWMVWSKKEEERQYTIAKAGAMPVLYVRSYRSQYICVCDLVFAYRGHHCLIFTPEDCARIRQQVTEIFAHKPNRSYLIGNIGPSFVRIHHLTLAEAKAMAELLCTLWNLRYFPQAPAIGVRLAS